MHSITSIHVKKNNIKYTVERSMPVSKKVAKGWVFLLENKSVTTNKTIEDVNAYY